SASSLDRSAAGHSPLQAERGPSGWQSESPPSGEPIDVYCDRHRLDIRARLRLFEQVCCTVERAHQHGKIFGDLRPAYILTTDPGVPALNAPGTTMFANPAPVQRFGSTPEKLPAQAGGIEDHALEPEYASPEQVRGEPLRTA